VLTSTAVDVISDFQDVWFESLNDKDMYVQEETDNSKQIHACMVGFEPSCSANPVVLVAI
jgi:hypothetical protein